MHKIIKSRILSVVMMVFIYGEVCGNEVDKLILPITITKNASYCAYDKDVLILKNGVALYYIETRLVDHQDNELVREVNVNYEIYKIHNLEKYKLNSGKLKEHYGKQNADDKRMKAIGEQLTYIDTGDDFKIEWSNGDEKHYWLYNTKAKCEVKMIEKVNGYVVGKDKPLF